MLCNITSTGQAWANAPAFLWGNNRYIATYAVQVSANMERLFPSVVSNMVVTEIGEAKVVVM